MRPSKLLPKNISESLGKLPPQAIDMEEAVLGAVLLEKNAIDMVPNLRPEHFYKPAHQLIYQAVVDLKSEGKPTDMRTVGRKLIQNGQIEIIGGYPYIAELTTKVNASDSIKTHAALVIEMAIKRGLISIAATVNKEAYDETTDCFELVDKLKDHISRIEVRNTMDVYLQPSITDMYQEYKEGKKLGHYCQIEALKDIFCWVPSFLMGITGMSGKGKTTLDSFLMLMAAKVDGRRWGIWSPEMITSENRSNDRRKPKIDKKATQIYFPLIKSYTGQNPYPYFPNQMHPDVFEDARKFVEEHFYVIDTGRDRDYMTVIEALRWATLEFNLYGWVIDPFKNLEWDEGNKTKDRILQRVLDEFKYLAVETNTVGQLILHPRQMNEKELREGGNPKGPYRVMTQVDLLGGSVWGNGIDSLHSYYRPYVHDDPNSPHATLFNLRQKMQDVTCKLGEYDKIYYEIDTNRFYFNNICPLDGSKLSTYRPVQTNVFEEMRRKYNEEPVKAAVVNDDENPFA